MIMNYYVFFYFKWVKQGLLNFTGYKNAAGWVHSTQMCKCSWSTQHSQLSERIQNTGRLKLQRYS